LMSSYLGGFPIVYQLRDANMTCSDESPMNCE
jgi:hypothetical protein